MIDELFTSIEDLELCPSTGQNMVSAASTVNSARKLLVLFWNPRIFSFVIFQIDQINRWLINYWTLDLFWHPNVWPSNFGWSVAKISHLFDKLILKLTRNFEWLGSVLYFELSSLVLMMFWNPVRIFPKRNKKKLSGPWNWKRRVILAALQKLIQSIWLGDCLNGDN